MHALNYFMRPRRLWCSNPHMHLKENTIKPQTGIDKIRTSCPISAWPKAKSTSWECLFGDVKKKSNLV